MFKMRFLLVTVLVFVCAYPAMAQSRSGVRAGISADPEQFYIGGHVDLKEVVERFWFRPNVEVGFGDGLTLATFNGEFVYLLKARTKEWTPYFGGGPAFVLGTFHNASGRHTDTGPGFNFVGGIQQQKGWLAEVKIGAMDSPSFKLGVGWTW
jgi:hypothetical protein